MVGFGKIRVFNKKFNVIVVIPKKLADYNRGIEGGDVMHFEDITSKLKNGLFI